MTSRPSDDCYKTGEPGDDRVRTCNPSDDCYKTGEPGDDRVRTCNPSDDCYKTGEPGDDRVRTCNPSDELMTNIPDNESEVDDVDDHHDIGRYLNDYRDHILGSRHVTKGTGG